MSRLRLEYVAVESLTDNPANWRTHPQEQLDALSTLIRDDEIGWANALLFNERTGRLIDGHGRKKIAKPGELVPVLIGSWSEEAERKILATLDPLAAMAETDLDALRTLAASVDWAGELAEVAKSLDLFPAAALDATPRLAGYEYKLVIDCGDEQKQAALLARLEAEGLAVKAMTI